MSLYLDRFDYSMDIQALPSGVNNAGYSDVLRCRGIYNSFVNCYPKYICKRNYIFCYFHDAELFDGIKYNPLSVI